MVNYWIFIARRDGGNLQEMRRVIMSGVWDFISRKSKPKNPQHYTKFKIGDFVLFYLAVTYPDGRRIIGGRSIIGKARLGSPYLFQGKYIEDGEIKKKECFVFLLEPYSRFRVEIEPQEYGIGQQRGQMVAKISREKYECIVGS